MNFLWKVTVVWNLFKTGCVHLDSKFTGFLIKYNAHFFNYKIGLEVKLALIRNSVWRAFFKSEMDFSFLSHFQAISWCFLIVNIFLFLLYKMALLKIARCVSMLTCVHTFVKIKLQHYFLLWKYDLICATLRPVFR